MNHFICSGVGLASIFIERLSTYHGTYTEYHAQTVSILGKWCKYTTFVREPFETWNNNIHTENAHRSSSAKTYQTCACRSGRFA